ncbi:MAG: acyl-CoA dehydrogenase family protein [Bacteroidota bacterium]
MFERNKTQQAWQDKIIAFAETVINPDAVVRETNAVFDRNLWQSCADMGLAGLSIPQKWGGQGMNAFSTVLALEALGKGGTDPGLNFALSAHLLAVAIPISLYGTDEQRQRLLPALCDGSAVGGNAITEATAGSDVYNMQTVATKEEEKYSLTGNKTYCSNGGEADTILTYALTNPDKGYFGGVTAFVLEKGKHNFRWSEARQKLGARTCPVATLIQEGTLVDATNRLGEEGAGAQIFQTSMTWERVCLGAIHLGAMDRMFKMATDFANERFSGGKNLSSYQAVTHPFANLKLQLESARLLTYKAAYALDNKKKNQLAGSLAKLSVSECYKQFCLQMTQLFASQAYETPHPIAIQLKAALGATLYSGTSEIHRNLVARAIGFKPSQRNLKVQ